MLTQTFCFIAKKGILKYNSVTRKLHYLYIYWFIFITPSMPYAYIKLRKFQKLSGFDSLCLSLWVVKGRFEYWTLHFLKYCRGGGSQIPEMILVCDQYKLIVLDQAHKPIWVRPLNEWQDLELRVFEVGILNQEMTFFRL